MITAQTPWNLQTDDWDVTEWEFPPLTSQSVLELTLSNGSTIYIPVQNIRQIESVTNVDLPSIPSNVNSQLFAEGNSNATWVTYYVQESLEFIMTQINS
jgi:hypothetical protein